MKKMGLFIVLVIVAICVYVIFFKPFSSEVSVAKENPIVLKRHSDVFNAQVDYVVKAYLNLKNSFVDADTFAIKKSASLFIASIDSLNINELKNDTASIFETAAANLLDIRSNAVSLTLQSDVEEMKKDFSMVTDMMYPAFFKSINYEGRKIYLVHCPMAFGDDKGADWMSDVDEIVNPYLGKHHPTYKATMLHCGEMKDSLQ